MYGNSIQNAIHFHALISEFYNLAPLSFFQGLTSHKCGTSVHAGVTLLQKLGFTIHAVKSQLEPGTRITFLGFVIDSITMRVTLTVDKKGKLLSLIHEIIAKESVKIRTVASLIGKMVSSFPGSLYGPLYYRNIRV